MSARARTAVSLEPEGLSAPHRVRIEPDDPDVVVVGKGHAVVATVAGARAPGEDLQDRSPPAGKDAIVQYKKADRVGARHLRARPIDRSDLGPLVAAGLRDGLLDKAEPALP
jgi:hypothetical protein